MTLPSGKYVKAALRGRVAEITLDRPPANVIGLGTLEELGMVVDAVGADAGVKAAVVTGSGSSAFATGVDLDELAGGEVGQASRFACLGREVLGKIETLGKPVIAAVNGLCLGGGCELAAACHLRLASDRSRFGLPEVDLGILPGWGGTARLVRLLGAGRATAWVLTGETVTAEEARRAGLVYRVVPHPELAAAARDLATRLAAKSGVAVSGALAALTAGLSLPLAEARAVEEAAVAKVLASEDSREGLRAFLERREPRFRDR